MRTSSAPFALCALLLAAGAQVMAQAKQVTLATLEWEPYIGTNLPGKGYVFEIVEEAFRAAGYRVEVRFYPWARAVNEALSGKVDGVFPEYYDERRRAGFVFSSPFPGGPVGFLARKASGIAFPVDPRKEPEKAFQGMKQYSFGVVRGYINTKAFDAAAYLRKDETASDEQNLQKLQFGRVDLIFIDRFVAEHLIRTKFPRFAGDLEFLDPPMEIKSFHIAFSTHAPAYEQKVKDFNQGLASLQKNGALKAILEKHGF